NGQLAAGFRLLWHVVCLRRPGAEELPSGLLLCISSAADDHFYRRFVRGSLLPGNHATGRQGSPARDDKSDGRERSRVAERRSEHLYGPNGGTPNNSPV